MLLLCYLTFQQTSGRFDDGIERYDNNKTQNGEWINHLLLLLTGKKANQHMRKEWRTLCEVIYDCGYRLDDGRATIRFGDLFTVSPTYY